VTVMSWPHAETIRVEERISDARSAYVSFALYADVHHACCSTGGDSGRRGGRARDLGQLRADELFPQVYGSTAANRSAAGV
jgi:hypothetical protein